MPMSVSDYLDKADSLDDMAMKASDHEQRAQYTAMSQVAAIQAVATAIERLAAAVEATR